MQEVAAPLRRGLHVLMTSYVKGARCGESRTCQDSYSTMLPHILRVREGLACLCISLRNETVKP